MKKFSGLLVLAVLLAACGGLGDSLDQLEQTTDTTLGPVGQVNNRDTGVEVTINGVDYVVDPDLGGQCVATESELTVYGYEVDTGRRFEMSFREGDTEHFASVLLELDDRVRGQTSSEQPWPWLTEGQTPIQGTIVMIDNDGEPIELTFSVDCS